ncbi:MULTISPECIES: hypothetical protein [unclassified Amycolatopsis]|uniref:hypothetical protein n=1 Tax=unclassified Amycolatopsis TaxID=2618356 RepID=UPI002876F23F|nr:MULTISPECIES: hypothetical protein [unclassified Amycolatopsis]MDS0133241.1 hypothetical protein [Amycolatopsis sp. 505]MDS0146471.1 hypothetical protein [Amycolatopsis sp. CM201R]
MAEKFGTDERGALIALTLANEEVPNAELVKTYGVKLSPTARERLETKGLIAVRKQSGRYYLQIKGPGITWCEDHLAEVEPPQRPGPMVRTVFEVLRRLVRRLRDRKVSLVDFLHGEDEQRRLDALDTAAPVDLETLIREAYRQLATRPQQFVRLAQIRPKLNGVAKAEVDEKLLELMKTSKAQLAPDSNRRGLTDEDRAAAIRVGREDKHLLSIGES